MNLRPSTPRVEQDKVVAVEGQQRTPLGGREEEEVTICRTVEAKLAGSHDVMPAVPKQQHGSSPEVVVGEQRDRQSLDRNRDPDDVTFRDG